mgnify:FL=1
MIIFDLTCADEHRFEGWFRSAEEFARQEADGLVACPHCGSQQVRRLPSAVHVATPSPTAPDSAGKVDPVALAKAFVEHLIQNAEDVGGQFADEARRIHYHDAPERAIRGEATQDEFEALQEEGIDVLRLPGSKPEKLN